MLKLLNSKRDLNTLNFIQFLGQISKLSSLKTFILCVIRSLTAIWSHKWVRVFWVIVILLFVTLITKVLEGKPETILMVSCDAFSSRFSVNAVLYIKEVILYKQSTIGFSLLVTQFINCWSSVTVSPQESITILTSVNVMIK